MEKEREEKKGDDEIAGGELDKVDEEIALDLEDEKTDYI